MTTLTRFKGRTIGGFIDGLRRRFGLLTEAEVRLAYLEEAQNIVDLEMRMRELDRRQTELPAHLTGSLHRT